MILGTTLPTGLFFSLSRAFASPLFTNTGLVSCSLCYCCFGMKPCRACSLLIAYGFQGRFSGSEVASLALRLRTIVWSNAFSHGTAAFEVKMFIKKRDNTKYLTKVCLGLNALA